MTATSLSAHIHQSSDCGWVAQIKNMFHKARWIATLMYLGALVGTLVSAIYVSDPRSARHLTMSYSASATVSLPCYHHYL
jgi:hypothetical protein